MGASGTLNKRERKRRDDVGTVILVGLGLLMFGSLLRMSAVISVALITAGVVLYLSGRGLKSRHITTHTASDEGTSAATGAALEPHNLLTERFAPNTSPVSPARNTSSFPYSVRQTFFSRSEGVLYMALSEAFASRYLIFPNVRLADICADPQDRGALNRIWSRHVDFILCEPTTFRIIAGIELDGWSHSRPRQIASDQFKDAFFERIGVPLIRYSAQSVPSSVDLTRSIAQVVRVAS